LKTNAAYDTKKIFEDFASITRSNYFFNQNALKINKQATIIGYQKKNQLF